jgi:hypothetical protein
VATLRKLPGRLAAGQSTADDEHICHRYSRDRFGVDFFADFDADFFAADFDADFLAADFDVDFFAAVFFTGVLPSTDVPGFFAADFDVDFFAVDFFAADFDVDLRAVFFAPLRANVFFAPRL